MSSTLDLRTVKPGDVVELRETYRVDAAHEHMVHLKDVHDQFTLYQPASGRTFGSRRFVLISKAPVPAPVAGDILTGYQVRERMWKRGTVIQCVEGKYTPSPLLLQHDGQWADSEASLFEFEDLNDEAHFKLLHVAQ